MLFEQVTLFFTTLREFVRLPNGRTIGPHHPVIPKALSVPTRSPVIAFLLGLYQVPSSSQQEAPPFFFFPSTKLLW